MNPAVGRAPPIPRTDEGLAELADDAVLVPAQVPAAPQCPGCLRPSRALDLHVVNTGSRSSQRHGFTLSPGALKPIAVLFGCRGERADITGAGTWDVLIRLPLTLLDGCRRAVADASRGAPVCGRVGLWS